MNEAESSATPLHAEPSAADDHARKPVPTAQQLKWLRRGLEQAGGKLPLFDRVGQKVSEQTVRSCIRNGWAEPWFNNPIKPDWLVCRLTDSGRDLAATMTVADDDVD